MNNILCLREALARGADEVVITNLAGEVAETAVSNIAFVRGGEVLTPPLTAGILGGVTRDLALGKIAANAGLRAREASTRPEDFARMDECFLLSTTKDITPGASIDARSFSLGENAATMRLKHAFADYTQAYAGLHPELRVF